MEDVTEERVRNRRRRVALIAGGYTREREFAMLSGDHVASLFDGDEQYQVYLIHVDIDGWFYTEPKSEHRYLVDKKDFSIRLADGEKIKFDLALLLVVGPPGENGQLQGYLELVRVPYIGCGVLASAITFNKGVTNRLIRSFNSPIIHISPSCDVHCSESTLPDLGDLHLPVIVKPVDSGSSLGVSKVTDLKQLPDALSEAFDEAKHVLIEQFIVGREITVGVVRLAGRILVLPITEIIQSQKDAFYDAAAKFGGNTGTKMITPADLAETTMKQVEAGVSELYEKLELSGLVQFDLILEQPGDKVFFLEVDSTPSQASNSIIGQQLTQAGWAGKDQVKFYKQLLGSPR